MKAKLNKILAKIMLPKGYSTYFGPIMIDKFIKDFRYNKDTSIGEKIWCYKRGFISDKKTMFNLNDENYTNYISDVDYYKIHPINKSASKWIDDKLTTAYMLQGFKQYLPKYYFQLQNKSILKLMDCPLNYNGNIDGIIKLLKSQKELAVKQLLGSLGEGFYKLSYDRGLYYINNKESNYDEIERLINELDNYIITEYLNVHDDLGKIFNITPNTLRIMSIYDENEGPKIIGAFIRFGTSKTGMIEHGYLGGICANINLETGEFYDGRILKNNFMEECNIHPDTNISIKGNVPYWDLIKDKLMEISNYMPQVLYMGWDIVVTNDGFKILEINSHQNIDNIQYYQPLYTNKYNKRFFEKFKR